MDVLPCVHVERLLGFRPHLLLLLLLRLLLAHLQRFMTILLHVHLSIHLIGLVVGGLADH